MKGRIFIAWSGNNQLARQVKEKLERHDYIGVVGGEEGAARSLFVGNTVLDEIDHCNQAIIVVQLKELKSKTAENSDGPEGDGVSIISNNLMFEFGYSLARFTSNKIHIFYIDIAENDSRIPSDLRGGWADHYMSSDYEDIAEVITNKFLADQKHIIPENKMAVVDGYYGTKEMIQRYASTPQCSEYELAQYVLFFAQAAYMFNNEREALECLKHLSNARHNPSEELSLSVTLSILYMEALQSTQKTGDTLYLSRREHRNIRRRLCDSGEETNQSIERRIAEWGTDDFTTWFRVLLYDTINYTYILYASNPELSAEERAAALNNSIPYAEKCLEACALLLENPTNHHFVELYKAYMYRNLATAQKLLSREETQVRQNLDESYRMREKLWDYYNEAKRINSKLLETFEMEYYLALSELLEYIDNEDRLYDSLDECREYISRVKALNLEKSHFIHKIESTISAIDD